MAIGSFEAFTRHSPLSLSLVKIEDDRAQCFSRGLCPSMTDFFYLFAIMFMGKLLRWGDLTQVIAQPAIPAG